MEANELLVFARVAKQRSRELIVVLGIPSSIRHPFLHRQKGICFAEKKSMLTTNPSSDTNAIEYRKQLSH